jgi:hypothetical protein
VGLPVVGEAVLIGEEERESVDVVCQIGAPWSECAFVLILRELSCLFVQGGLAAIT